MSLNLNQRLGFSLLALGCDVGLVITAAIGPAGAGLSDRDGLIRRWCYLALGAAFAFAAAFMFDLIAADHVSDGERRGPRPNLFYAVYILFLFVPIAPFAAIELGAGQEIALKACAAVALALISVSAATMVVAVPTTRT